MTNFSILGSTDNTFDLHILESLYISSCKPQLSDTQSATPLNIAG